jgi:uncharacterized membrane protein
MAKIEASLVINRAIEEVFAFAGNVENNPQWQSGVLEARVTSEGPIGAGTTYRYVSQLLGRRIETDGEITEYEPNRKYSFKSISGPFPIEGGFTFEAAEGGHKGRSRSGGRHRWFLQDGRAARRPRDQETV